MFTNRETKTMANHLMATGDLARRLGIQRYQLEYLIATGAVPDTTVRVAGKRVWDLQHLEAIRAILDERQRQTEEEGAAQ